MFVPEEDDEQEKGARGEEMVWEREGSGHGPSSSASSKVGEGREAVWSGTDGRRVVSLKGKRESGKREAGGGEENTKTSVVVRGRGKIKSASAMLGPRRAGEVRVEGDDKLAGMWMGWEAKS